MELVKRMDAPDELFSVAVQAFTVAKWPVDGGYENPWDTALAAYLWALEEADHSLAVVVAEAVIACPCCWWSRKLAKNVRSIRPAFTNLDRTLATSPLSALPARLAIAPDSSTEP
jgi:hypothetical protein